MTKPTRPMRPYDLKALRVAANAVCRLASPEDVYGRGATNWGNFYCPAAERWEDETGTIGYRVWIQEADEDNWALQKYIRERLANAGFPNVEVRTEW